MITMAESQKKRHRDSSTPEHATPAKRSRHRADDDSTREASSAVSSENPMAGIARHRCGASRHSRSDTPLPSTEDWNFRVKVISSTMNLSDDIFEKAVQGLVKICYPQGIIEELGVDQLAQHMREEEAPDQNIARMREVFHSQMIGRLTGLLAKGFDTTAKVQSALKSIIDASLAIHPDIGDESLDVISRTLVRRADSTFESIPTRTSAQPEGAMPSTEVRDPDANFEEMIVDTEEPIGNTAPRAPPLKSNSLTNKRVSTSWRWDLDEDHVSSEVVGDTFKRPSDLFAYHALPIAKNLLVSNARQKDIRLKIQAMLDDTPEDVYNQWVESFRKLHAGDESMLVRVPPESKHDGRTAATPAPLVGRRRSGTGSPSRRMRATEQDITQVRAGTKSKKKRVKREDDNTGEDAATGSTTLQHATAQHANVPSQNDVEPLTEDHALGPTMLATSISQKASRAAANLTPIVDILWGRLPFSQAAASNIVRTIMWQLNRRTAIQDIKYHGLNGILKTSSKGALKRQLQHALGEFSDMAVNFIPKKIRFQVESFLRIWVIAHPSGFPELVAEPFMFAHMMPLVTPVLELLCTKDISLTKGDVSAVKNQILHAFKSRGIVPPFPCEASALSFNSEVKSILNDPSRATLEKRRCLERYLRHIVFVHRKRFPELRTSRLVKSWEASTGASW